MIINCPECGNQVSDAAVTCPHCGFQLKGNNVQVKQQLQNDNPPCPETHLAASIILALLCCLPFGIPAIINAASVTSSYSAGNYDKAVRHSNNAHKWCLITIIAGAVYWVLSLVFILIAIIAN